MFVKISPPDRLISFSDSVWITLLAVLLLLPLPNCILRVCLRTPFAAVLKFFLPLTSSAISITANSNKSAPMHLAAGTIKFTQKWNCSFPNNLCKCTESPSTLSTNTSTERNLYLSWSNHLVTSLGYKWMLKVFLNIKTRRLMLTDTKGIF